MTIYKVPAKRVIQLNWKNWNDVCSIDGLVSRDFPAKQSSVASHHCGDKAPFIELAPNPAILAEHSLLNAKHGDYIAELEDGKVLIIAWLAMAPTLMELINCRVNYNPDEGFLFKAENYPEFSTWRHRNGNEYIITGLSNVETPGKPEYPPTVHYVNKRNGKKYSGKASDWFRRMTLID